MRCRSMCPPHRPQGCIAADCTTALDSQPCAVDRLHALILHAAALIENCKISGVNPLDWLTDALSKPANSHPANAVGELMPWTAVG